MIVTNDGPGEPPAGGSPENAVAATGIRAWLPPWWIELLVLVVGYGAYQLVQAAVRGSELTAVDRARGLWSLQAMLHVTPETSLNTLVAASPALVVSTGLFYGIAHFTVTPAVLIWIRAARRNVYPALRNTLVLTSGSALLMYWLLPLAPPRLSLAGIVDTLKEGNILSAADPSGPASFANPYAAMPSLHVAWATWVALAIVVALPHARWRHLAWAYPLTTTFVVLGTGNHFVTDAAAGALLVAVSWRCCCPRRNSRSPFGWRGLGQVRHRIDDVSRGTAQVKERTPESIGDSCDLCSSMGLGEPCLTETVRHDPPGRRRHVDRALGVHRRSREQGPHHPLVPQGP